MLENQSGASKIKSIGMSYYPVENRFPLVSRAWLANKRLLSLPPSHRQIGVGKGALLMKKG